MSLVPNLGDKLFNALRETLGSGAVAAHGILADHMADQSSGFSSPIVTGVGGNELGDLFQDPLKTQEGLESSSGLLSKFLKSGASNSTLSRLLKLLKMRRKFSNQGSPIDRALSFLRNDQSNNPISSNNDSLSNIFLENNRGIF